MDIFRAPVLDRIERLSKLGSLRETNTRIHPLFGEFNAHKWQWLFSFHLTLHFRQAERLALELRRKESAKK